MLLKISLLSVAYQGIERCGMNIAAETGTTSLTSPNYPTFYDNNLLCNWTITASMSYRIAIRIIDIDLQQSYSCSLDYLKINLGGNKSLETDKICRKNNTDLIFISRSNIAYVTFVTDGSGAKRGFLLQYQAVPICGGGLTAQTWSTSLNSPNYPYQYANNLYCLWTIEAGKNYRIGIRITYFDLEEHSECSKDYLQIYLGSNPILETSKICRKNHANVYFLSVSNDADIIFVTDGSTTMTGFSLEYQGVALVQSCGGNLAAHSWTTTLTSPNYPYLYENNLRCNWTIQASINSRIAIRFIDIDLEQSYFCSRDYLEINLGCNSVGETDRICRKNNTDLIFISSSNKADVIFVTDRSLVKRGFILQYQAGIWSCEGGSGEMNCHVDWDTPTQDRSDLVNIPCVEKAIVNQEAVHWIASVVTIVVASLIIVGFYCWCRHRRNKAKREVNRQNLARSGQDDMESELSSRPTIDRVIDEEERERSVDTEQREMQRIEHREVNTQNLARSGQDNMESEHPSRASIDRATRRNDRYHFTNYGYVEENPDRATEARSATSSTLPRRTIEDIFSEMNIHLNVSDYKTLYIKRSCVWKSALRQFRQKSFRPADVFYVKFVDDQGNEEGALDAGGPRREYFQLMMDHLADCSLFEGPSGRKLLSYDVQANRRNEYFYAGMVIGQSMLFKGPVPRFLSPLLLDCLILGPDNVRGSREDIYDSDYQQLLDEGQTTDCICNFVSSHNKTLHFAGCLRNVKMENREQLIQDLINYYLVERTRPAFEKFKKGLQSVGVYDYILRYPDQFRELFSRHETLTAEKMSATFTINYSYMYSQDVEDKEEVERKTVAFWETYLCIVETGGSQIHLEDIMMFATGMKEQADGQTPNISFHHPNNGNPASKYPTSSTCSCTLYLPLHDTLEEFKKAMDFGILNGSQFGRA